MATNAAAERREDRRIVAVRQEDLCYAVGFGPQQHVDRLCKISFKNQRLCDEVLTPSERVGDE